jgi:outer membrane protein assembly factor BamB
VRTPRPTSLNGFRSLLALRRTLLFLGLAGVPGVWAGADWPQFLGPNRNGTCPAAQIALTWPKEGPPQLWQRKVGEGFSAPVVSGGKLILFHRVGDQETVEALDAGKGGSIWKSDYPTHYRDDFGFDEGPRATPAVADGRIFTYGADGMLSCWALETGAKQWSVDTPKEFHSGKGFFGRAGSPLVEGNAVIVDIGGRPGAGIVAFEAATGKLLWKATDEEASYSSPVAANFGGRRRVLALTRGTLTALDPANGRVIFQYPWHPPISSSVTAAVPLVLDDLIFLSASYGTGAALLRYKDQGPEKIWAADEVLSNHYATSVERGGFLYGFDGRQEHGCVLRCVELKTGKVRWSEDGLKAGTVTLAGDHLLVLTERGELILAPAAPAGFKPLARAQVLPFVVRAYPALADGRLYARSKDQLVCLDLRPAGKP